MPRIALVLLAALCTVSAGPQRTVPPAANPGAKLITLSGDLNSCASWVEARKDAGVSVWATGIERDSRAWMWGFISGASAYGRRPLAEVSSQAVDAWVDKYCEDHALVTLDAAGMQLVEELAARAKR